MIRTLAARLKGKSGRKGFTLQELMAVVAIIVVVCAIAIPSITALSRSLEFRQRNNYAKQIFLAAQSQLTDMRSEGTLPALVQAYGVDYGSYDVPAENNAAFPTADWSEEYRYISASNGRSISADSENADAYTMILPLGSVDETIRTQQVFIEFNPYTGNVFSVFYSEEGTLLSYDNIPSDARTNEKARKELMLGYYEGSGLSSAAMDGGGVDMEETAASVWFTNGEEGIVTVSVPIPSTYLKMYTTFVKGLNVDLTVTREPAVTDSVTKASEEGFTVNIKPLDSMENCTLSTDGKAVEITYVLDSLTDTGSFANKAAGTMTDGYLKPYSSPLTNLTSESRFTILPGENVTLYADVTFDNGDGAYPSVEVESGMAAEINPMFDSLVDSGDGYILTVTNGRNLQNLNALSAQLGKQITVVNFGEDIYWNKTVEYYNENYGSNGAAYCNSSTEAPARQLPYFVPINSESLFGVAAFAYPKVDNYIGRVVTKFFSGSWKGIFNNTDVPTLTDEIDLVDDQNAHAAIQGNGSQVYYLDIDVTKYTVGKDFYAGYDYLNTDRFAGLFGYVNTTIDSLNIVNPKIKGYKLTGTGDTANNPATGALVGCTGWYSVITNCGVYLDTEDEDFNRSALKGQASDYDENTSMDWYGVWGSGSVGGMIGYAKSNRTVDISEKFTGEESAVIAFSRCFAAVNVTGTMRSTTEKDYGYSNGVGGLVGNAELTNFYNCYASGNVIATNVMVQKTPISDTLIGTIIGFFTSGNDTWYRDGRTSWGAGGFVGSSHGIRYTNCFASGNVVGTGAGSSLTQAGVGCFVGVATFDETTAYGNTPGDKDVEQHTVFTSCYAVGNSTVYNGGKACTVENFTGANARIRLSDINLVQYWNGDFYDMMYEDEGIPDFEAYYYKDCYYIQYDTSLDEANTDGSKRCAKAIPYDDLTGIVSKHADNTFVENRLSSVYDDLYDSGLKDTAIAQMKQGFNDGSWQSSATAAETHPYSLTAGRVYPFSIIKGMDYYGDWNGKVNVTGLAYYEEYTDGTRGFYFNRDDTSTLKEDGVVVNDGYALITTGKIDSVKANSKEITTSHTDGDNVEISGLTYRIYKLDISGLTGAASSTAYYTKLSVSADSVAYEFLVNPDVALSQINPTALDNKVTTPDGIPNSIFIRSARQLAAISNRALYCDAYGATGQTFSFVQQLDIDFSQYTGKMQTLSPIGSKGSNGFNSSYTGISGYSDGSGGVRTSSITGDWEEGTASHGYFSTIGTKGVVSNLVILNPVYGSDQTTGTLGSSTKVESVGLLADENRGTVRNVEAALTTEFKIKASKNAGTLVGTNSGTIAGCSVSSENTIIFYAENSGAFVGSSTGGIIENCSTIMSDEKYVRFYAGYVVNAGGIVGCAENTEITESHIQTKLNVKNHDNNTDSKTVETLGGIAGKLVNCTLSGTTLQLIGANGDKTWVDLAGVAVGSAEDTSFRDLQSSIDAGVVLYAKEASGFLGSGTRVNFTNVDTVISGVIEGKNAGAGMVVRLNNTGSHIITYSDVTITNTGYVCTTGSAGSAAGYVVEASGVLSDNNVILEGNRTTDNKPCVYASKSYANGKAAGFAVTVTSEGEITGCTVSGTKAAASEIRANGAGSCAAGFVYENNGVIRSCVVSPARHDTLDTAAEYRGNSNANLLVNATGSSGKAAGFVLENNGTAEACSALCKVSGKESSGGAGFSLNNNAGAVINRCMANTTVYGSALVQNNNGTVTSSYAWYANYESSKKAVPDALSKEEQGKYYGCYFAELDTTKAQTTVTGWPVYVFYGRGQEIDGKVIGDGVTRKKITLENLSTDILNPVGEATWFSGILYGSAYPYSTITVSSQRKYTYPSLHKHYGDWMLSPADDYGVIYYENVGTENNPVYNMEFYSSKDGISFDNISDGNESTILETGYLLYAKNQDNFDTGIFVATDGSGRKEYKSIGSMANVQLQAVDATKSQALIKQAGLAAGFNLYQIPDVEGYALTGLCVKEENTANGETTYADPYLTVNTLYARAINVGTDPYEIRTSQQLSNVTAESSHAFKQTHTITLDEDYCSITGFQGEYDGNGSSIELAKNPEAAAVPAIFASIDGGTVRNLAVTCTTGKDVQPQPMKYSSDSGAVLDRTLTDAGLFACSMEQARLENITLTTAKPMNAKTNYGGSDVEAVINQGVFAGSVSGTHMTNVVVNGSISGSTGIDNLGIVAGRISDSSELTDVVANGTVTAGRQAAASSTTLNNVTNVGGFAGQIQNSSVTYTDATECTWSVTVLSSANAAGGFAGVIGDGSTITNLKVNGTVNGGTHAGGFAGIIKAAQLNDCAVSTASVTGETSVGGFVGETDGMTYTASSQQRMRVQVTASGSGSWAGGFAGLAKNASVSAVKISALNGTTTQVTGGSFVGGFAGAISGGSLTNTAVDNLAAKATASGGYIGGFAGKIEAGAKIFNSQTQTISGTVDGGTASYVGGFAGYVKSSSVERVAVKNAVTNTSSTNVGGFAGVADSCSIYDANVTGEAGITAAAEYEGGFAGQVKGSTISYTLSTGSISTAITTSASRAGLFAGVMDSDSSVTSLVVSGSVNNTKEDSSSPASTGGFVGEVSGSLSLSNVRINKATVTGKQNVGGFAGSTTANGSISGVAITNTKVISDGSSANIGGMVGLNKGSLLSGTADVTVQYNGQSETGSVFMGGIVGKMAAGSIGAANESGTAVVSAAGSINTVNSGIVTGPAYHVGGAVGGEYGAGQTSYTNVTTAVNINDSWPGAKVSSMVYTNSDKGSVGLFIGSVQSGTFTNCSATTAPNTHTSGCQFLGSIVSSSKTASWKDSDNNAYTDVRYFETNLSIDDPDNMEYNYSGSTVTSAQGTFTLSSAATKPATLNTFSAKLTNCTYLNDSQVKQEQYITSDYYFNCYDVNERVYSLKRTNNKDNNSSVDGYMFTQYNLDYAMCFNSSNKTKVTTIKVRNNEWSDSLVADILNNYDTTTGISTLTRVGDTASVSETYLQKCLWKWDGDYVYNVYAKANGEKSYLKIYEGTEGITLEQSTDNTRKTKLHNNPTTGINSSTENTVISGYVALYNQWGTLFREDYLIELQGKDGNNNYGILKGQRVAYSSEDDATVRSLGMFEVTHKDSTLHETAHVATNQVLMSREATA